MTQPENTRAIAARIIGRWLSEGDFPDRQLESSVVESRAFVMELVYGVVRWKRLLEWAIGGCVRRMPKRGIRSFLLTGAYQVLLMVDQEAYAAVNETVEAAKAEFSPSEASFVNAVLRKLVADKEAIIESMKAQPVGVQLSHPDILIDRWTMRFGKESARRLCEWNNSRPKVVIRMNRLKTGLPEYRASLRAGNVGVLCESNTGDGWYTLEHGCRVADVPGYCDGHFVVVDRSVGMAVEMLDPQPGDQVLDACAAPGGKTFLIAEQMRKKGRLRAVELHRDRLLRLRENLRRLGCDDFVELAQGDATELGKGKGNSFDRILLDVPCMNTGVIRRRPDVRWRFSEYRLSRMTAMQNRILNSGLSVLKPGGVLVYSTCSLEPEENEDLVRSCLKKRPEMYLAGERRLFPPDTGTDGAYAALIRRKA